MPLPLILVVDDEPSIRDLLRVSLEEEGFGVITAEHGAAALELMERQRPDVILVDLHMPEMDGRAFYRRIRSDGRGDIPVVLLSAHGAVRAQRELGAEAAIAKPFELDLLLAEIRRLIK